MNIITFNTIDDIDEQQYTALKNKCGASIFYDIRFLRAAEKSPLLPVEKIYYFAAYEKEELLAFACFYQQASPDPFGVLEATTSIQFQSQHSAAFSHIMHCYESVILVENPELYSFMLEHLKKLAVQEGIKYYGLLNVIDKQLMQAAEKIDYQVNFMWERFFVDFSQFNSLEDFLSRLTRKGRQAYRTEMQRFEQSDAVAVVERAPFHQLDEVVELCYETTSKYGTGHYYPKDAFLQFIETCGDLIRLISIYVQGKRVGVVVALLEEKKLHLWACGMQYENIPFSPYIVGIFTGFKFALKNNISIVEIGRTNKKMKEKLGFSPLPLYSIINYPEDAK